MLWRAPNLPTLWPELAHEHSLLTLTLFGLTPSGHTHIEAFTTGDALNSNTLKIGTIMQLKVTCALLNSKGITTWLGNIWFVNPNMMVVVALILAYCCPCLSSCFQTWSSLISLHLFRSAPDSVFFWCSCLAPWCCPRSSSWARSTVRCSRARLTMFNDASITNLCSAIFSPCCGSLRSPVAASDPAPLLPWLLPLVPRDLLLISPYTGHVLPSI